MYLLLKLTMVTAGKACLFAGHLNRALPGGASRTGPAGRQCRLGPQKVRVRRVRIARMAETRKFTADQLTGRARSHLVELSGPTCTLHREAAAPFLAMRAAAAADGIDLVAFSSFRDFDRQLGIWNGKFRGERPMQDRQGRPLDVARLTAAERLAAILWWSALPGTSRHHWGTDFDVLDA